MGERHALNYTDFCKKTKERLIRYAKIDTQSEHFSDRTPTTDRQRDLAEELYRELNDIGAQDVYYDRGACVVYAKIKGNGEGTPVGFIAHLDTSPDAPGAGAKPHVLENYDGGDVVLNPAAGIVMRRSEFENLSQYVGCDLVLTDGTTLLGGDDKAAIAAIMTAAEHLAKDAVHKRADVCIAFTPDEEVGGLAKDLDLERFGAPVAYTVDGDHLGYYEDETFNASAAIIEIEGFSVHTGTAYGKMKNAVDIAAEFMASLPEDERPQNTRGVEGLYHVVSCRATCESARIEMIIRDFDADGFLRREKFVKDLSSRLGAKYGGVSCRIVPQYRNMKEVIDGYPYTVDILKKAIYECGVTPVSEPFRGGTDGAALSFRGLPCPNLSAGYENAHGRFEYVPVQSMAKNVEIIVKIAELYSERK